MKTLIIHPSDSTTDFLRKVYTGLKCSVVSTELSEDDLSEMITAHDRVIFLGHGTALGLLGWGRIVFHSGLVNVLKDNRENMFIWCNADEFVAKHHLQGFFTGMFISEPLEARIYRVDASIEQINTSNNLFARLLHNALSAQSTMNQILEQLKAQYSSPDCEVTTFNSRRLYYADRTRPQQTTNI